MTVSLRHPLVRLSHTTPAAAPRARSSTPSLPRLLARAAVPAALRRHTSRSRYRYVLTPLETMFRAAADESADRARDRALHRRVLVSTLIVVVFSMVGLAIVLKQLIDVLVGFLA